tara:strand:- start:6241 stop:7863 length:1623 start_codon:yes stop_codon:yes gene_type:complete
MSGYLGKSTLKSAETTLQYTKEQLEEYIKCLKNPVYFIDTYCQIVTLDKGLQPFKLYPCQVDKIKLIHENRKVILMEGRQQGKTTTSAAYILWYTIFQESKTVAILANKATAAREVLNRYQIMFENLPTWLQQGVTTWNKGDVYLENGSVVFTAATAASGIRGKSVNMLYVDETAIIPHQIADDFFTSVYPTISAGETTKILLSSTPLGYNHFWKFWNDAKENRNGFIPLFIPYTEIPGRDAEWANEQLKLLGELKYNQEVLCEFLGSSDTLIRPDIIRNQSASTPIWTKDNLDVYEDAQKDRAYVLVADTSRGVGQDYSAFIIFDATELPYKIVAKYRSNEIEPLVFPTIIQRAGKEFNNAYVLLEINSHEQVAQILYYEYEYENVIFVNRSTDGQVVSGGFGGGKTQLGVFTDVKTKRIGCSNLKSLIEEQKLIIPDADIISEMSTFIRKRTSYAADEGYHDDLMMCLVLFSWLSTNPYFKELTNVDIRTELYHERIKRIESEIVPFGLVDDGVNEPETTFIDNEGQSWQTTNAFEKC